MNIEMSRTVNNLRSRIKTPSLLQPGDNQEDSSSKEPVQVEPKSYFALERTYIQWISAALLLLTVSSIMMGSGSYNGTSSVIAFSSLVLIVYASYCYFRRVKLLRSGNGYGYLDIVGPSILAAGVGLGVFIVFADAVKGSEFMPFGKGEDKNDNDRSNNNNNSYYNYQKYDDRRLLTEHTSNTVLQEVQGQCSRHSIQGINLLEYQPRDIVFDNTASELIVGTPQSLVSHPLDRDQASAFLSEIPDTEIQSVTMVGDRLFALSTGPTKTELIELSAPNHYSKVENRFLIQEATSTTGSMVFIPSEDNHKDGKFYIYLDGTMHTYHMDQLSETESSAVLSRSGSINMKVLNRGLLDNDDPIAAMEHFEGVTYVLREKQNTIEAWDLSTATLLSELALPGVSNNDQWVGLAFQRVSNSKTPTSNLRQKSQEEGTTSVYLHMPLDSFPPQLWSFRLEELEGTVNGHSVFSIPQCGGVALN